jgi:hypothetical protein
VDLYLYTAALVMVSTASAQLKNKPRSASLRRDSGTLGLEVVDWLAVMGT